jgi:hypothetical protein
MKKLTIKELEKKMKYHNKRSKYYEDKIESLEKKNRRIGFIHYDK